jgi:hypothetical protein
LVSNAFFQIGKTINSDVESFCFADLDEKSQTTIANALKKELKRDEIDLSSLHYIYTAMNLLAPQNDLRGKITGSFEKIKGCEPTKPNALYRLIVETVTERACYELSAFSYDEVIRRKGITKSELEILLNSHMEKTDNSVTHVLSFIERKQTTIGEKKKLKSALAKVVKLEFSSKELQLKEAEISSYIEQFEENEESTVEEMVESLYREFDSTFSLEYSSEEKYVFFLLIIKRWEDGKYE